jgi:hypothetical protein
MNKKRMSITEATSFHAPTKDPRRIAEAFEGELPLAIFTEIHAITANWITRNHTFYPTESLLGNPNQGSGIRSFTHPYPVPILRDHISSPSFFGDSFACEPFGRIYTANFVTEQNGGGWVRTVAAITDPWAISRVLSGRFLTVSIGGEVDEVYCSVCTAQGNRVNMVEHGLCDHAKGQTYDDMLAYWTLGPLYAREVSFVNVPSDVNAGIVTATLDDYEARTLLAGTDGEFLLDMASGSHESVESYRSGNLGISRQAYKGIIEKAKLQRARYNEAFTGRAFTRMLENPDYLTTIKSHLKGL